MKRWMLMGLCFSGAAALMADTQKQFEQLTGGVIVEGYSLTEAQMAVDRGSLSFGHSGDEHADL